MFNAEEIAKKSKNTYKNAKMTINVFITKVCYNCK